LRSPRPLSPPERPRATFPDRRRPTRAASVRDAAVQFPLRLRTAGALDGPAEVLGFRPFRWSDARRRDARNHAWLSHKSGGRQFVVDLLNDGSAGQVDSACGRGGRRGVRHRRWGFSNAPPTYETASVAPGAPPLRDENRRGYLQEQPRAGASVSKPRRSAPAWDDAGAHERGALSRLLCHGEGVVCARLSPPAGGGPPPSRRTRLGLRNLVGVHLDVGGCEPRSGETRTGVDESCVLVVGG
jgi:hypothetical protein